MPARIKPFSVSPSMAPFLFVPLESAVKVLKGAPLYSSCRYLSENLFLTVSGSEAADDRIRIVGIDDGLLGIGVEQVAFLSKKEACTHLDT